MMTQAEEIALFNLLKFVEKQYDILKDLLPLAYLVIHFESKKSPSTDLLNKIFEHIENALQHAFILESARIKLQDLKKASRSKFYQQAQLEFIDFQNISLIATQKVKDYNAITANFEEDLTCACALTYLPKKWQKDDLQEIFILQKEFLCLQAWLVHIRRQFFMVHTQSKQQHLLYIEKSRFAPEFYQNPGSNKQTWVSLNQYTDEQAPSVVNILKLKITQIEAQIFNEEAALKRHCAASQDKHFMYFYNALYYEMFPPSLKHPHSRSLVPWVISFSMLAFYKLLDRSTFPVNTTHLSLTQYSNSSVPFTMDLPTLQHFNKL
jgi:hypothetical protein